MAVCPNCGNENTEDKLFCPRCGFKLETEVVEEAPPAETENVSEIEVEEAYYFEETSAPAAEGEETTEVEENQPVVESVKANSNTYVNKLLQITSKKWFFPAAIGAAALVVILLAVCLVVSMAKPSDRTPRGAAEWIFDTQKEYAIAMQKSAPVPEELAPYMSEYNKIKDYVYDNTEFRVTDVEKDGDKATVTIERREPDWTEAKKIDEPDWSDKKQAKKYLKEVLKALKKSEPETDSSTIDLVKQNGHWKMDNQSDFIAYNLGIY